MFFPCVVCVVLKKSRPGATIRIWPDLRACYIVLGRGERGGGLRSSRLHHKCIYRNSRSASRVGVYSWRESSRGKRQCKSAAHDARHRHTSEGCGTTVLGNSVVVASHRWPATGSPSNATPENRRCGAGEAGRNGQYWKYLYWEEGQNFFEQGPNVGGEALNAGNVLKSLRYFLLVSNSVFPHSTSIWYHASRLVEEHCRAHAEFLSLVPRPAQAGPKIAECPELMAVARPREKDGGGSPTSRYVRRPVFVSL